MFLKIKAFPNSKENIINRKSCDKLEVHVRAKPERGLANSAIIALVAEFFNCSAKEIRLIKGHTGRSKIIDVPDAVMAKKDNCLF